MVFINCANNVGANDDHMECRFISSYQFETEVTDVAVEGDYAYVCVQDGVRIVDIHDPDALTEAGMNNTTGIPLDITVAGNFTYIADSEEGFIILNTSNNAIPEFVSEHATNGTAQGVAIVDDHAFIADGENGLVIISIENKSDPVEVGHYDTSGEAHAVLVEGDHAYIADGSGGLVVLDVSNSADPDVFATNSEIDSAWDIAKRSIDVYIADLSGGLNFVSVYWNGNTELLGQLTFGDECNSVSLAGSYCFSTVKGDGLVIVDPRPITDPKIIGGNGTSATSHECVVSGSYAYVADGSNGLSIFQIIPVAWIDSVTPGHAALGQKVDFLGHGTGINRIVQYAWRSFIDGELYNGTSTHVRYYDLSLGNHTVYLKVMDDQGVWSKEVSFDIKVTEFYPTDYDLSDNMTVISLFPSEQTNPSIDDNIIVWLDDRNGGKEVFLFDLDRPDSIRQISDGRSLKSENKPIQYLANPLVSDGKVVWYHHWGSSSEKWYAIRMYEVDDPVQGGEVLLQWEDIDFRGMEFSGDRIVWSEYSGNGSLEKPYTLHMYNIMSGEQVKLFDFDGTFALHDDRLVYVDDPENQTEGSESTILVVYDLAAQSNSTKLVIPGKPSNIRSMDLWGDHVVWEGYHGGTLHYPNHDIFLLDIAEKKMADITEGSDYEKEPSIHSDIMVWAGGNGPAGSPSVYGYSISQNTQAVIRTVDGYHPQATNPMIFNDMVIWERPDGLNSSTLYLRNIRTAPWVEGNVTYTDVEVYKSSDDNEEPVEKDDSFIPAFEVSMSLLAIASMALLSGIRRRKSISSPPPPYASTTEFKPA